MDVFSSLPISPSFAIALIVLLPLAGAIVNGVLGKGAGNRSVGAVGVGSVAGAFALAVLCFVQLLDGGPGASLRVHLYDWFTLRVAGLTIPIQVEFVMDALSGVMTLVVTGIGLLIHIYSLGYMAEDSGFRRFFTYLNLFMASMLILVLAGSFPLMFVGWEGVGLCSYLLIGFWFENKTYALAGKKAFIANRVGDFGVIIGMFMLMMATGTLDFEGINRAAEAGSASLLAPAGVSRGTVFVLVGACVVAAILGIAVIMLGRARVTWGWLAGAGLLAAACFLFFGLQSATLATAACMFIFLGCTGKSAQIPLFVWLPDAMAGPTPVSALIHAATMVTSGIYLCCRLSNVFALSPSVMAFIAVVGAATALLAASIAVVQNEMKKILAYSTVSQLGFMFAAVGCGAFAAGIFHVFTHAFFKACLFLGAGAVMHAVHAHGDADVRLLGNMKKKLPTVHWTFLASCLAISGMPIFSGWFSKDEILFGAYASAGFFEAHSGSIVGGWVGYAVFITLFLAATMTAYYMFRLYFLTFGGEIYRSAHVHADGEGSEAHHGEEGEDHLHGYAAHPHPPEPSMAWPLRILAAGALLVGLLHFKPLAHVIHLFAHPDFGAFESLWEHWLTVVVAAPTSAQLADLAGAGLKGFAPAMMGFAAMAIGIGYAYSRFAGGKNVPGDEVPTGLHKLVFDKWRVDEIYDALVIEPIRLLAAISAAIDKYFVDVLLTKATATAAMISGAVLSRVQTGVIYAYGAVMMVGVVGLGAWFFSPHPRLQVESVTGRSVAFSAASGHGYRYRWDYNGDGDFDDPGEKEEFSEGQASASFPYTGHEQGELVLRVLEGRERAELDLDVYRTTREIPASAFWEGAGSRGGSWKSVEATDPLQGTSRRLPVFRFAQNDKGETDESVVVLRPNSAIASAAQEEIRLAAGGRAQIGRREFVVAKRITARLEVKNAFGFTGDERVDFVLVPDAPSILEPRARVQPSGTKRSLRTALERLGKAPRAGAVQPTGVTP